MTSSGPTGDAFPSTAVGPEENGDGIFAEGGGECGGGVELFPVNFTEYQHHPSLRTDEHVQEIYELLAPYSVRLDQWTVPPEQRDRQAVEDRLRAWKHPDASRSGNTVLYWLGHGSAERMAHHRTPAPIDDGTTPQDVASAIADRQLHPNTEHSWSIVVLDACFSKSFAKSVERALTGYDNDLYRYVLLSTAARGPAELGAFTEALRRVLRITFRGRPSIGLAELGNALVSELGGHQTIKITNKYRLYRTQPDIADSITASLDELDEVRAVIANLSADEQRHFLPKASGAELGELAWYFQGRAVERNEILHWLTTATSGALVVTGPAGAGKSALLGHILHYTLSQLRDILLQRKALQHLPPGIACPDDPFDLVTHLVGLTSAQVLHLIAQAAGLTDLAVQAADDRPPADLVHRIITELRHRRTPLTLLFDALDEAEQPLVIANQILRPLAALPTVRLIVGTRSSTREGPDHPAPTDTDILDALRPRPHPDSPVPPSFKIIDVNREKAAFADYLRAKLGKLHADHASIEEIVRRLVTDHPQDSAETQQFLHVRLVAHELLNDPRLLADPTPLIGRTHRQLFTQALQRLHRTNPHYTPLLRALGLTQGRGLPDQDNIWAHAANALGSHADTSRSISGLVRDAAPYITADHENGQSVYRFAHRTFAEHFVTAPDASQAHADITAALIRRAREDVNATLDGTPRLDEDVSPYIRHHLAAHARLGHAAGALNTLADHPDVLDTLDLTSISSAALYSGLPAAKLPPPLAGIVLFYNQGHRDGGKQEDDETGWRRWWRRLGTAYIHGTVPPGEPLAGTPPLWPPTLAAGVVRPRQLNQQLTAHTDSVSAVAVFTAVDGTARVVTGSDDGTVRIWNPTTSAQEAQLPHHGHRVGAVVVFTAVDGTARIITDSDDGVVRIWNPTTSAQEAQLPHHGHKVGLVAVFTGWDGIPRVVTGSDDGTVRIWNPTTRTREHKLTSRKGRLRELAVFTALDGILHVVTGSDDGVVRIWNPTRPQETRLTSVTASVSVVAVFTAVDGTPYVVTGSYDGTVRIWNPTTRTQEAQLTGHGHRVGAVAVFTAVDGTPRVVAGSDDGVVRIWNPTRSQEARLT
ncbi:AAA family ATPase, partial [Streptomyces globisporus]|uniref:AAA family ATPase n=1 Tax=Streptomyces globisporus TaxID=1908 RepID=UPI0037FE4C51